MSSIRISLTEDDGLELMSFLEGALYAAPDDIIDGAAQRLLGKLQSRLTLRPPDSPPWRGRGQRESRTVASR
jgi:hypothetical protein